MLYGISRGVFLFCLRWGSGTGDSCAAVGEGFLHGGTGSS